MVDTRESYCLKVIKFGCYLRYPVIKVNQEPSKNNKLPSFCQVPVMPVKSKGKKQGDENDDEDQKIETSNDKAAAEELQKKIDGYLDPSGLTTYYSLISGQIQGASRSSLNDN